MTHKKRLLSALAVVAAGALMLTFAGPYKSGASDPVGVAALWGNYSDDNQYASKGTFNYDAPGDNEDVTLAASDITKLRDQIGKLALTAQAADAGLDSGMAGAVSEASTANTGALASLKASVDTLNATLASKEFGRDTTVMVYRTSVGNVDLAQATVYEAMTMSATGLPTFSKPEASLYAVYALGDNPAVDLTTATPLGLYSSCSGGGNSAFSLSYFPRGAYDKDTAVTLTLPANGSSANAYNVGKPYFFALARIAAADRETKFGKVAVAKAQQCNMTDLPAKCGSAESIGDAKYVFWFGTDISGEPAGIWKGSAASNEMISTNSVAKQELNNATDYGYGAYIWVLGETSASDGTTGLSVRYPNSDDDYTFYRAYNGYTLTGCMNANSGFYSDTTTGMHGPTAQNPTGSGTYTIYYRYYGYGMGNKIVMDRINITPVNSKEKLSGTDYFYWTSKDGSSTEHRYKGTVTIPCTCTEDYRNELVDKGVPGNVSPKSEATGNKAYYDCYPLSTSVTTNYKSYGYSSSRSAWIGYFTISCDNSAKVRLTDKDGVAITRSKNVDTATTKVTFAPLVSE